MRPILFSISFNLLDRVSYLYKGKRWTHGLFGKNGPYCEYIYCVKFQNKQRRSTNYPYWTLEKVGLKYAEQNLNRTWDICFQIWPFRSQRKLSISPKFWLWRPVPGKWAATRDFMVWLFLSWGIDYQIKNKKTWFGRITSWNFVHSISHCAVISWKRKIILHVKEIFLCDILEKEDHTLCNRNFFCDILEKENHTSCKRNFSLWYLGKGKSYFM